MGSYLFRSKKPSVHEIAAYSQEGGEGDGGGGDGDGGGGDGDGGGGDGDMHSTVKCLVVLEGQPFHQMKSAPSNQLPLCGCAQYLSSW